MGVDYGRRRIGVSVTDPTGFCVRGLTTIDCQRVDSSLLALLDLIKQEAPEKIIFGLPLGPRDEETVMSREVREFAEKMSKNTHLPFNFVDESFSSQRAEHLLSFKPKKKRRNKKSVDKIAACLILEQYLKEM